MAIVAYGESKQNNLKLLEDNIKISKIGDYLILMISDGNGASEGMINTGALANNIMYDFLTKIIQPTTSIIDIANQLSLGMYCVSKAFLAVNSIDERYHNIYASQSLIIISETSLEMCFASIGNTEIQLWRNQKFSRLNRVFSKSFEKLEQGLTQESEVYAHPGRGIVTSAYGVFENLNVDIQTGVLSVNDIIFMTTDGIFASLTPDDILSISAETGNMEAAVKKILDKTYENGGVDNASIICCFISE